MAQPSDIANAECISKGAKRYWIAHLCKYRNSANRAWPKMATGMADLVTSERSIQNYRRELLEANWICLPEGDAGGRPKDGARAGLMIHLHPDGKPCSLPRVELKQRTATKGKAGFCEQEAPIERSNGANSAPFPNENCGLKGAEFSSLRVQKITEKGAENNDAIRNELSMEPFICESSIAASGCGPDAKVEAKQLGAVDAASQCDFKTVLNQFFEQLQDMCEPPVVITQTGRTRICNAMRAHKFSPDQLRFAWRHDSRTKPGGVITLAEQWDTEGESLQWPQCFFCEDTGVIVPPGKHFFREGRTSSRANIFNIDDEERFGFCSCQVGDDERRAFATTEERRKSAQEASWRAAVETAERHHLAEAAALELQQKTKAAVAEELLAQTNAIEALKTKHICPKCQGDRGRQQLGYWHICIPCLGTGHYFTAEEHSNRGECAPCCGTGFIHNERQQYNRASKKAPWMTKCPACNGSGRVQG